MSIRAKCRGCGRSYTVKDEYAGKKFRCHDCQRPIAVPVPRAPVADWDEDPFGEDDDYEDYEARRPLPTRRRTPAPKKKKPAAKKSRPKKRNRRSSGAGAGAAKMGGGLVAGLIAFGLAFRLMSGLDLGGSWQSYTTPDGNITVQMPGRVKSVPVRDVAPGGQSFGAERRSFGCVIVIEPVPSELDGFSEEEMFNTMEMAAGFLGGTNIQRSTLKGHPCVSFEKSAAGGLKSSAIAFAYKGKFYTLTYAYKGTKGSGERKFFDSVQFN